MVKKFDLGGELPCKQQDIRGIRVERLKALPQEYNFTKPVNGKANITISKHDVCFESKADI